MSGNTRICKQCGKEIYRILGFGQYKYKKIIKGKTYYFCNWNCFINFEKGLEGDSKSSEVEENEKKNQ